MKAWIVLPAFLLAGCASPEQIAARRAAEEAEAQAQAAAYRENLFSQCRAIGYSDGTDQFRECVLRLHTQNQQARAAAAAAILQGMAARPAPQPYQIPPLRTPTQTNCYRYGNQVNCTTY